MTLVLALLAPLLAGCDAEPGTPTTTGAPSITWRDCPSQVALQVTTRSRCGVLTVPLRHAAPDGRSLDLQVVQVWPAEPAATRTGTTTATSADVAASVGFNFGEPAHEPGLMALLAERLDVPVVSLAPRGVGAAGGTSLDCRETQGLGPSVAGEPDRAGRDRFLAAVGACRDRLAGLGTDLSAFGVDDVVADLEALRAALQVPRWHTLVSYGEMAAVSDGYAAAHPDRVTALVKDSPVPTDRSMVALAGDGLRSALSALFEECRDDPRCASRYPDLGAEWEGALARTATRPLQGAGPAGAVLVDAPKLVRAVKAMLGGDGPGRIADLPRVIAAAADGQLHPALARVVAGDPDHCNGYRPICSKPGFSLGAHLSQACPSIAPPSRTTGDDDPYAVALADHPYAQACAIWAVPPGPVPATASAVPALVLTGHLDSFSRAEWFPGAVVVRGATHDVSGSSACAIAVRTTWRADPGRTADANACAAAPLPDWD